MQEPVIVFDTSAVLAHLNEEAGWEVVQEKLDNSRCLLCTVNFIEVVSKLVQLNSLFLPRIEELVLFMGMELVSLNSSTALQAGMLITATKTKGLSLGDRACIALAIEHKATVLTADRVWLELELPVSIVNFRQHA